MKKENVTAKFELSRDTIVKGGEVLVWGKGTDGQLGMPKCTLRLLRSLVYTFSVTSRRCAWRVVLLSIV